MRISTVICLCTAWAVVTIVPGRADACRYSVREVGFVDLDRSPYRLYVFHAGDVDRKLLDELERSAALRLRDANVELSVVNMAKEPEHAGEKYLPDEPAGSGLRAVLVSADERVLAIDLGEGAPQIAAAVESIVESRARDAIRDAIVDAYCVVVLIEGPDDTENEHARTTVKESVDRMTQGLGSVEKPTEVGPKVVEIPRSAHGDERVLLWALGMEPEHVEHPGVALLFGRARRIGSVLRGDRVEADELARLMMFVGASCECGLDRSWMQGPMLPIRWDRSVQERLAKHLGFNPENPMVKMEMSQILAQGSDGAGLRFDDPFMGYREFGGTSEGPGGTADVSIAEEAPVAQDETLKETAEPVLEEVQPASVATPAPLEHVIQEPTPERSGSPILAVLACVVAANVVILLVYWVRARGDKL